MTWQLWFLNLSGWPVFLAIVVALAIFMIVASVVLTWLGNRSVLQNMVLATITIALLAVVVLAGLALLTRANVQH